MASKIIEVPMHEISVDFYVRQSLSEDRVASLAALVAAGTELPPIVLNDKYQIIDGRHRFNAYKASGKTSIKCEVRRNLMLGEQILEALTANMGGSLPPSQGDIKLAIANMIAAGLKYNAIIAGLPLPASVSKRYIKEAQSNMTKQKLRQAVDAVAETDMGLAAAAQKFNVSIESLRQEITGKKRKLKEDSFGLPKIKAAISSRSTTYSHQNAKMFQKMMEAVQDGDLSYRDAMAAVEHAEKAALTQAQNVAGWKSRVESAKRNTSTYDA